MRSLFRLLAATFLVSVTVLTWAQAPDSNAIYQSNLIPGDLGDPVARAKMIENYARERKGQEQRLQAKEALERGDTAKAFLLLQQAVSNNSTDDESCVLLSYFYIQKGQPDAVIATLDPIVSPPPLTSISMGQEPTVRMLYVLALLERQAWRKAVACYQKTWSPTYDPISGSRAESHLWHLPGGGPEHSWPDIRFSADTPDYKGMRAQAHLILGTSLPACMKEKDQFPYMLDHLRQVLQINPNSLDAHFVTGWLLAKKERFAEARAAYASAIRLADPGAQKEIAEELKKLKTDEDAQELIKANQAAKAK